MRRWLLRPLAWSPALLALLALLAVGVARSDWLAGKALRIAEQRGEEYLGRAITIEALELELLPPGVVASGVAVAGEPGEEPFASASRVEVVADLRSLLRREPRLRAVIVDAPRVRIERRDDGSHNVPIPRRRGGGGGTRVTLDRLLVRDGVVWVEDHGLPLDLAARDLDAQWTSGRGDGFELVGTVSSRETTVAVAGLEPYEGSVRGRVRLGAHGLEILENRLQGEDLEASASGTISWGDGSSGELRLVVDAAGGILPRLGLTDAVEGAARFEGALTWRAASWLLAGHVESRRLTLLGRTLSDLTAALRVDPEAVRLESAEAVYRGGSLSADVTVTPLGEERIVLVRGRLEGGRVEGILVDQGLPLEGLAGTVDGSFEYRFDDAAPLDGTGWADLAIQAARAEVAGGLPVRGQAPLLIEAGLLSSRAIHLETPAAEADLSGSYDLVSGKGSFDLRSRVTDPHRILAVMAPEEAGVPSIWRPVAGIGEVTGSLTLTPGYQRARLALDFSEVRAAGYSADRLQGQLTLSGAGVEGMRLELSRPEAALVVQGRVPFDDSGAGSALSVQVEAASWPWRDVSAWLPWELPVEGEVSGSIALAGDVEALDGFVAVRVAEASVGGVAVDGVAVDLGLVGGRIEVNEIRVGAPAGEISLTGSLGEEADLRLRAAALSLVEEPFAALTSGLLSGALDLDARLTGSLDRPAVVASLVGRELTVGERILGADGSGRLDLEWHEGEARLDGTLLGLVEISGGGTADMERFDLSLDLSTGRIEDVIQLATGTFHPDLGGHVSGELTASGTWTGENLQASLTGEVLGLSWADRDLRLLEPYRITLADGGLTVESLFLGDEAGDSELFLFGDLPLTQGRPFDLRFQVALSSAWAEPLLPAWTLGPGRFEGLGAIRGTADDPRVSGQGEVTQSSLLIPGVPGSLQDIAGYVLFDPGRVVLDSFRAEFAGGALRAEGAVALPGGEADAVQYQLQASAEGVTVRYPEGFLLRGGAEVGVTSTAEGRRISGVVELDRAFYLEDVPIGFSQLLQRVFERQRLQVRETDELLATTELNILVRGPDALSVRNNVADLDGDIDLAVRGTAARPVVFGSVEVEEGGRLVYSGNEYVVQRAVLTFANPFRIEPVIDLVATTELREYDVTLTLAGTLDQLSATVVSDPPLADLDVLALLTSGGDLPETGAPSSSSDEQGSAAGLLYGQAASAVAKRFNRLFGLDKFRIDPLTESSGGLESARVTVGERLSNDLFATYSYDPSRTDIQILELEWQVSRVATIIATQNGDGTYALDVRWQKSF